MDYIEIEGGVQLHGHVRVSGAKNAALPIIASLLLTTGETRLRNVPRVRDVVTFGQVLQALGAKIRAEGLELVIDTAGIDRFEAPYELVKTMRASFLVLGPLLARYGQARVSLPGGCAIGARPVNLHLKGLEALGAHLELTEGYVNAYAGQLRGATVALPSPTVTGTENIVMAAVLAKGTTVVENAACEPEVVNLAEALRRMGADVRGAGSPRLVIEGVPRLEPAVHDIIPDRIEAGTFLVAGAITGGDVTVDGCQPEHLTALLERLRGIGAGVEVGADWVRVSGVERARPIDIVTAPYPGFATDMQAQMMALLTRAEGRSVISETVFENRYMHAAELCRMGAEIRLEGADAVVTGVPRLRGAPVMATDLRASAGLILAGLAATGITTVSRVYHLDRGYEQIEVKLAALGAKIRRLP
ncbi:MAG TPA: UDP-N-acetylglucosamine 1-carboxyvinyltransferase [Candidatus Tectomicrobia bacterium]|jgi:UDP-N-acetylglucosamine 1-carboxyvinyltransferase|nr:UDP-N-acetylglucosamine 1-carboxyvinyltransferase [Candidatus Tectomicrobia bacterium]